MNVVVGNWHDMEWEVMRRGIRRKVFTGEGTTVTYGEVQNGHEKKPHRHIHEQVALILQGECDFWVEDQRYSMKAGGYIVIPSNVEHYIEVTNSKEPVINLDIFVPSRLEYAEEYREYLNRANK